MCREFSLSFGIHNVTKRNFQTWADPQRNNRNVVPNVRVFVSRRSDNRHSNKANSVVGSDCETTLLSSTGDEMYSFFLFSFIKRCFFFEKSKCNSVPLTSLQRYREMSPQRDHDLKTNNRVRLQNCYQGKEN